MKFSDTKVTHEKSVSLLPSPTHLEPLLEHFLCMPPRNTLQGAFKLGTTNMWGWVHVGPADPGPLHIQYPQQHTRQAVTIRMSAAGRASALTLRMRDHAPGAVSRMHTVQGGRHGVQGALGTCTSSVGPPPARC